MDDDAKKPEREILCETPGDAWWPNQRASSNTHSKTRDSVVSSQAARTKHRRKIARKSTKIQARSLQNRRKIDLGSSWATKAVSETRPDELGTAFGRPNGAPRPILGRPGRAKSVQEPSERVPELPRRRSKTLPVSRPNACGAPSNIERIFGSICRRFVPVARKLRCAKNVAPATVLYTSHEV